MATWSGLIVLGSFSSEIWRAFCIVALIRHRFSAWLAIVLAALFFATVSLQISIARALGAAAFGGAAGFLFVNTGSLLAPLAMGVIGGLAKSLLCPARVFCRPASIPRYSRPFPVCGDVIQLSKVRWAGDMVPCPNCGECLTTKIPLGDRRGQHSDVGLRNHASRLPRPRILLGYRRCGVRALLGYGFLFWPDGSSCAQ